MILLLIPGVEDEDYSGYRYTFEARIQIRDMHEEPIDQVDIARKALDILFSGKGPILRAPEFIIGASFDIGPWKVATLEKSLMYLKDQTGHGNRIDPFIMADGTAWIIVAQILSRLGLSSLALQVAEKYLETCYDLQEKTRKRINKGAPLFWLSQKLFETGEKASAIGFMLLAYTEDIISDKDATQGPGVLRPYWSVRILS